MHTVIDVTRLCSPCLTRARGQEAAEKVKGFVKDDQTIIIDLDTAETVSLSFLDGLISRLIISDDIRRIIFKTNEPTIKDKLARIAGIRSASLRSSSDKRGIHAVVAKPFSFYKTTFVQDKSILYR